MNVGYARTSSFENPSDLQDQISSLKASGCEKIYSEQASVTDPSARKEWAALLKNLKSGDVVTITKISRAAASISEMAATTKLLTDKGATIKILDMHNEASPAGGVRMLAGFTSVAQFEKDMQVELQKGGIPAFDDKGNQYRMLESATKLHPRSGGPEAVYDYTLADTGEPLRYVRGEPGVFLIPSKGVKITDSRAY